MSTLPVKTALVDLRGRPKYMEPAPVIKGGVCSDCGAAPTGAGRQKDGSYDFKVCPKCWGVLWCRDFAGELWLARRAREEEASKIAAEVRALRAKARRGSHVVVSASKMTLRTQRRRLIGLLRLRAEALWRERI